jgi:hypothetical protein
VHCNSFGISLKRESPESMGISLFSFTGKKEFQKRSVNIMPEEVARGKGKIPALGFKHVMSYVTLISF